jgi:bacteriochlorophyllide a dehydrogenase
VRASAVVFTAPNTVEFRDGASSWVECPDPGPDHAVVRVTHSWISNGTEGSFLRGERVLGDTAYRPGDPWPFPLVPGYQKVGVVEWIGDRITDLTVGEVVFCAMGNVEGMYMDRGGHISPSVCARSQIWKLPHGPDPVAFSGLVLTQVGYNCGTRSPLDPGDSAVVVGDGMVGNWAAQTLAWRGANVILVGRHTERLARFPSGIYRHTINANETDWVQAVKEIASDGVRVAVDTVGSVPVVEHFLKMMQRDGHIVSAGFYGTEDLMSLQPLRYGELSLDMVSGWSAARMNQTVNLVAAGYLETLPLITHRMPVSRVADAWEMIAEKRDAVLGIVLDW